MCNYHSTKFMYRQLSIQPGIQNWTYTEQVSKFHCRPIAVKCDNFGIKDIDIGCSCVRCTAAVYLTYEPMRPRQ